MRINNIIDTKIFTFGVPRLITLSGHPGSKKNEQINIFYLFKMNCLDGYEILKEINENVWIITNGSTDLIVKKITIDDINEFNGELNFAILAGQNDIGPRIYEYRLCNSNFELAQSTDIVDSGLIIMEKLDGNLMELWPFIGLDLRQQVTNYLDSLIQQMHNLDIAHGDLHARNIGYKEINDTLSFYIIDYEKSFNISTGKYDPKVINWMKQYFDWNDTYESFVNFENQNWKDFVSNIPIPTDFPFQNIFKQDIIDNYLIGDCGLLAISLSNKSGWSIYGISLEDSVPAHYVVRTPGGQFFIDVTGVRSFQYLYEYWMNYFLKEGINDPIIVFGEVDNVLCNIDYYNDIVSNINNVDVDNIASKIWTTIQDKYLDF